MVRYQVDSVFKGAADGAPTTRHDLGWVKLLSDEDAVRLLRIFEALRRIDLGTYGLCAGCGGVIEMDRLQAEPEAHQCEVCAMFSGAPARAAAAAH